ncbi:hypothetical protein DFS33DRAFT_1379348 [Desarmillaria ectypa]|nr:hypothetical protein DFS33DRAFT_1379348 [Desarmillaria ectypa]
MTPFGIPPGGVSHLSATPAVVANKEGGKAGIVVDDDNVIDTVAEKRLLAVSTFESFLVSFSCALSLVWLEALCESTLSGVELSTKKAISFQGNAIILNTDTGDSPADIEYDHPQVLRRCFVPYKYTLPSSVKLHAEIFLTAVLSSLSHSGVGSDPYDHDCFPELHHDTPSTSSTGSVRSRYATSSLSGTYHSRIRMRAYTWDDILLHFYSLQDSSRRISLMYASKSLGAVFGGSIAYGVGGLNGVRGLEGWRWLFLIEGTPSCLLAMPVFLFLPAYPENETWLSDDDRALAVRRMTKESSKSLGHDKITRDGGKSTLKDGRLYLHYLLDALSLVPYASVGLFSPTIINGLGYQGLDTQLFASHSLRPRL